MGRRIVKYTERDFKQWKAYEKTRQSGQFNMVTDFDEASKDCKLSINIYTKIIRHYEHIKEAIIDKYGSTEDYMAL